MKSCQIGQLSIDALGRSAAGEGSSRDDVCEAYERVSAGSRVADLVHKPLSLFGISWFMIMLQSYLNCKCRHEDIQSSTRKKKPSLRRKATGSFGHRNPRQIKPKDHRAAATMQEMHAYGL